MFVDNGLVTRKFGRLIVVEIVKNKKGRKICRCRCKCGSETFVEVSNLKFGRTVSCGCRMKEINRQYVDITSRRYNDLIVEMKTDKRRDKIIVWKCRCIKCGHHVEATKKQLERGYVKDCGNHSVQDLFGVTLSELKVLSYNENKEKYYCQCSCGQYTYVKKWNLLMEKTKSCGCLRKRDNFERIDEVVPGMLTSKLSKRNTSGVKGVSETRSGKWIAYITLQKKRHTLGVFTNKSEAIQARKDAEEKLFLPILEKYSESKNKHKILSTKINIDDVNKV